MSAFAWLVSLAPLPVGSGQCLVFFPRLLFTACSFRCAWRFSRYSPQNGAEERVFDLLSRGQWGIKRSELLVRAHNWNLWNNSLTIFKAIADRENFSWRFLQSWKRYVSKEELFNNLGFLLLVIISYNSLDGPNSSWTRQTVSALACLISLCVPRLAWSCT